MRSLLITGVLVATVAAQTPTPQKIVVSRTFANPGQVGPFYRRVRRQQRTSTALLLRFRL